jgi:amino acid adenylation domain-containing protein
VLKKDHLEEERELLRRLLEKEGLASPAAVTTPSVVHESAPLSYGQEQVWFLDQLQPGKDFYNVVLEFDLRGKLDSSVLERSLEEIVHRHGTLRTCFVLKDGRPEQKIEPVVKFRLGKLDVRDQAGVENRRKQAEDLVSAEAAKPFDLQRAPLLRAILIQVGEQEHVLGLSIHHIVFDEWSLGVLQRELGLLYAAYLQGQQSPLKEMPVQYADYTLWQAQWLKEKVLVQQLAYWKKQLTGMPAVLELPTDKPRPALPQHRNQLHSRAIRRDLWEGLKRLGREEGATLFMTLLAAYEVLLLRYTGQNDFGVGTPVSTRNHVRAEGVIGYCVNTLVMRADLAGKPTFREVLKGAKQAALEGFANQELPLEQLVQELGVERRLSHLPLFQVIFTLRNELTWASEFGGLQCKLARAGAGALCDLALTIADYDTPILEFHYAPDLFEMTSMERMLGHYERLLQAVVNDAEQGIWELPLLNAQEMEQLERWNQTAADYPRDKTLAELFEEQAARSAKEVAVVSGKERLTYEELDHRSNRVARYLKDQMGIGPETLVGLSMERSIEMIVGMLGIIKAGAAYIPLDPAYPAERLRYMVENAGAAVVLSQERLTARWADMKARVVCLDRDWNEIGQSSGQRVESVTSAQNLAYVMYTSGSTGLPKGSGITQRNVLQVITKCHFLELQGGEVMALAANSSFDGATFEIWNALLTGGRLVCIANEVLLDARRLRTEIQTHDIQMMFLTTALFNEFGRRSPETFDGLKQLMFGGEAVNAAAIAAMLKHGSGVRLINLYGPVECTTFGAWFVAGEEVGEKTNIPIGRPAAGNQVYVLDQGMNLAPVGMVGELYLGGEGVGRGYWRRPGLTAERFLPNPYSEMGGERLYRTGDRGRWLADGNLEYLGRIDTQVKIRGFRVELGEIEAVLQQQIGNQSCVVALKSAADGSKRLVAYVTGEWDGEQLRRGLKGKLPEYMVPSAFVNLRELPLTANGKIDRRALPDVDISRLAGAGHYEAPRTVVEQELAKIWADVLQADHVGMHDNFFALGGHSILATVVAARAQDTFGVDALLRSVFESPTIAELAEVIELNLHGKDARGKLPQVGNSRPGKAADQCEVARTAVEQQLAKIWAEVLQIDHVGIHDNFFTLGGHSILATVLATRVQDTLGVDVLVRSVFESPTIAELAEVIELSLRGNNSRGKLPEGGKTAGSPRETSGSTASLFPLSYAQEQLWFLDRFQPGSDFYNVAVAWRIKGDLDVSRLSRCLQEVMRRHEVLRTCFVTAADGAPRQKVVSAGIELRLSQVDLRHFEADEKEQQAKKVLAEEGGKPFDLSQAPLMRGVLVRLADNERILGLTIHHIICDDWSFGVLWEELGRLYGAYGKGEESPLAELGMQYKDYAIRQKERLQAGKFRQQMEYWKRQLEGMPEVLELPTDRVRPSTQSFRGRIEARELSGDLMEALNALARREKASLFMTLLAACQVLMMRYSGQEDFGLGTVVANRNQTETEEMIGFFLSTLVVRARLQGQPTVREVLQRVREAALSAYANQDVPFEKLVEELAPNRDVSRTPLFQVVFTFRSVATSRLEFAGLDSTEEPVELGTSKFDLIMIADDAKQGATVAFNYNTDLFEEKTIRRMLEHYERLLEGMVASPDQPIWSLPMMDELEETILSRSNFTHPSVKRETNVVELFEAQAEQSPQAMVEVSDQVQLSAAALNRRANQLAHYLVSMGVAPESPVGIFMPPSQEMMVTILGVLKAGGAYVPLEVLNPPDRLRSFIDSSGAVLLLTLENLRIRLPQTASPIVCLDSEWELINRQSGANPKLCIHPQNLACLIYTSASGERAKGLMIEHDGLMARACASSSAGQDGRAPENIWLAIGPRLTSSSFLVSNSAFFTRVSDAGQKVVRLNGDATIYVLDPNMQRVAIGVPGELWIAGSGAVRGYLAQPALTAEKFLPDHFSAEAGARMWGSGERGRFREDGTIELLGRLDDQAEVDGFRFELSEIEDTLANHESVRHAAAVVRTSGQLVAYVVTDEGVKLTQDNLRSHLEDKLPSYMMPSIFITLRELPRDSRGKLDRKVLSALGEEPVDREFVLPRTDLEQTIAAAWRAVLGVDQVGVHDNFFDLGGHSLLVIQLLAKLRNELSLDIELLHLFQFPTIDTLVRFLQTGYNFDIKLRGTRERAGSQKSAVQKLRRMHASWTEMPSTE